MSSLTRHRDPLLGYFTWAVEGLPETQLVQDLLRERPAEAIAWLESASAGFYQVHQLAGSTRTGGASPRDIALAVVNPPLANLRWEFAPDYFAVIGASPYSVVENAKDALGADSVVEPRSRSALVEAAAHRTYLRSVLGSLAGEHTGLLSLVALLIRGGVNRRLSASHLLGLLTEGEIGLLEPAIPTTGQMLSWAESVLVRSPSLVNQLPRLAREYANTRPAELRDASDGG